MTLSQTATRESIPDPLHLAPPSLVSPRDPQARDRQETAGERAARAGAHAALWAELRGARCVAERGMGYDAEGDGIIPMALDFVVDLDGSIHALPVTGWVAATIAGLGIFLGIRYAEKPEQLETGGKMIQFALTAQQCLDLAAVLTKQANAFLSSPPSS
jgi:hypothetical protein